MNSIQTVGIPGSHFIMARDHILSYRKHTVALDFVKFVTRMIRQLVTAA